MSIPSYMGERAYTYHLSYRPPSTAVYVVETPEAGFEQSVYDLYAEAEVHLQQHEYALALAAFEELQLLILATDEPAMPVDPNAIAVGTSLVDVGMLETIAARSASMLAASRPTTYAFPSTMVASESQLPADVRSKLEPATGRGLVLTSFHGALLDTLRRAEDAAARERYAPALELYDGALTAAPAGETLLRGALLHDMALLADKLGDHARAVELGKQSAGLVTQSGDARTQVRVLDTLTGVYARAGQRELARQATEQGAKLRAANNLEPIVGQRRGALPADPRRAAGPAGAEGSVLLAADYVDLDGAAKTFVLQNVQDRLALELSSGSTIGLLQQLATTTARDVVMGFAASPIQMIAYLPHMYFFVIPMAIGDCLLGLGNLEEAETTYVSTLEYPFINRTYEAVRLWTRLADVYLASGDRAYRAARDDASAFGVAREHYRRIVRANGTLDLQSPLYADSAFDDMQARVEAVLAAEDPSSLDENPEIVTRVLGAKAKLDQIAAGLNFFGVHPDYLPPRSFEYLQTTARYFAQAASGIEQRYITFKSTAESEELRREQLDQQAEVAREGVELEQRGLDEANAAVAAAQAGVALASTQLENAIAARDEIDEIDWEEEMLEALEHIEDKQQEPKPQAEVASVAVRTLARRAPVAEAAAAGSPEDRERARLEREVETARAAKAVALAQLAQAEARVPIAEQRVLIAQLQQAYCEENRDYLDMREFAAGLWFELAAQARALTRRYLDMGIEIAALMERAYNAETERGIHVIGFDYGDPGAGDLLGADRLLADIDSFTFDYVTTVQSKKLPVKRVISVANEYPLAFQQLRAQGRCQFATTFELFDRANPGMYLSKVRNVEVALVGVTSASSVAGSLRTVGVSRFRRADGSIVTRAYPGDVLPISQYDIRSDALLFRFDPNELRAFELNGIDAMWQLELPQGANTFDLEHIVDIELCLYYDGFFDAGLEARVLAELPDTGAATRLMSLAQELPDELFFLKSSGSAEIEFSEAMFPSNQRERERTDVLLKLTGDPATVGNLTLRLDSREHGSALTVTTDADGLLDEALAPLHGEPLLDAWTLRITAQDNPHLVRDGELDLSGLGNVLLLLQYQFLYR